MRYSHGHTGAKFRSRTYSTWESMLDRCRNPKNPHYMDYGGRGITVTPEWCVFINFLRDMGERPPDTSIDRIDNSLGYCKDNCRWATRKEQTVNRRNTFKVMYGGVLTPLSVLADSCGLSINILRGRIEKGWSIEDAVSIPKLEPHRYYYNGLWLDAVELCAYSVVCESTLRKRLHSGMEVSTALTRPSRKRHGG